MARRGRHRRELIWGRIFTTLRPNLFSPISRVPRPFRVVLASFSYDGELVLFFCLQSPANYD